MLSSNDFYSIFPFAFLSSIYSFNLTLSSRCNVGDAVEHCSLSSQFLLIFGGKLHSVAICEDSIDRRADVERKWKYFSFRRLNHRIIFCNYHLEIKLTVWNMLSFFAESPTRRNTRILQRKSELRFYRRNILCTSRERKRKQGTTATRLCPAKSIAQSMIAGALIYLHFQVFSRVRFQCKNILCFLFLSASFLARTASSSFFSLLRGQHAKEQAAAATDSAARRERSAREQEGRRGEDISKYSKRKRTAKCCTGECIFSFQTKVFTLFIHSSRLTRRSLPSSRIPILI